jgi:hypothetical protein
MKIDLVLKSPWTLFVLALAWSVFRLRAAYFVLMVALAPVFAVAVVAQIYDSLDEYKGKEEKPFWMKLPFVSYFENSKRFSASQKRIIATSAVLWAFLVSLLSVEEAI